MQYTVFGEHGRVLLLVDLVILLFDQARDDAVDGVVLIRPLLGWAADDERRARLVDQDRVDFVDDGVDRIALHHRLEVELHVVAEIVEAVFVVGTVGDVAAIRFLPLAVTVRVLDHADGKAEDVDRDDVNAAAGQGVEIDGERGHQRLSFAGLHLRDLAAVQDDAAHELDVEVAHVEDSFAPLAGDGEGLGEDLVEGGLQVFFGRADDHLVARDLFLRRFQRLDGGAEALAELEGLAPQLIVGQRADRGLECVDLRHDGQHLLDVALMLRSENGCEYFIDHGDFLPSNKQTANRRGLSSWLRGRGALRRRQGVPRSGQGRRR